MLPAETRALLEKVGFDVPADIRLEIGSRKARLFSRIINVFDAPPLAFALGSTIYVPDAEKYRRLSSETRAALLAHECEHVHQWRRLGRVGFSIRYLREYFRVRRDGIATHDPAQGIDLEREAITVEQQVRVALQNQRQAV